MAGRPAAYSRSAKLKPGWRYATAADVEASRKLEADRKAAETKAANPPPTKPAETKADKTVESKKAAETK